MPFITAEANGITLTKEEAEAYLAELSDYELDSKDLDKVAGGTYYDNCPDFKCQYSL